MGHNLTRKTVVTAKTESTYGTNAGPNVADNTQLVFGDGASVWQPDTTMLDSQPLTGSISPGKQLAGRSISNVSIETALFQDTADGTDTNVIPVIDPLLRACGMDATPSGTYVHTYLPAIGFGTDSGEAGEDVCSATIFVYQGGSANESSILSKAYGVYLNADFNFTAGQAPTISFSGQGKYVAPLTQTLASSITNPTDTRTLVESESLTIEKAGVDTITPICRSLTFATGNNITERTDINADEGLVGFQINSRSATLNLVIEAEDILPTSFVAANSTGPFFADLKSGALHNVEFTHTTTASTITTAFSFPTAQLTSVSMSDDGGIRVYNLAYTLTGTNNEYSIVFTNTKSS